MNKRKALERARNNPDDIRFSDFLALLDAFGYRHERTSGRHRVYIHPAVPLHLDVQPRGDGKA